MDSIVFYNGKLLCLRGGEEHCKLKFSQFTREHRFVDGQQKVCYVYTEHGSKNHSGGIRQLHQNNKVVYHFEIPEAGKRDYVRILDLYFSKVPKEAIKRDNFYLRPLSKLPEEGKPWFTSVPLGRNKLGNMVKDMCKTCGIEGNKMNHSLRAFDVTTLFEQNASEKLITEHSGHRSLEALRVYERTSDKQLLETSRMLTAPTSEQQLTLENGACSLKGIHEVEKPKPDMPEEKSLKLPEINQWMLI